GPGKKSARPASIGSCAASRKRAKPARRGNGSSPSSTAAISGTRGPETRTIPIPPLPGGVAAATMVSVRLMLGRLPPLSCRLKGLSSRPPTSLPQEAQPFRSWSMVVTAGGTSFASPSGLLGRGIDDQPAFYFHDTAAPENG